MSEQSFDPMSRPLVPLRGFEELKIGERYPCPARTITDAHFSHFQALSGDNHPIHYDRDYCRAAGHDDLLAHGLHVLALTAAGAGLFPHVIGPSLVGFIEVQAKFLKGVFPGDTLYPLLEITALEPQRTTGIVRMRATVENQKSELVLDGTHAYLLRLNRKKDA
ncbi:MAG: MaoC family dehydratase [Hyphomonadaceae bacterium]